MENLIQHFQRQPFFMVIAILSLLVIVVSIPYFIKQQKKFGSPFLFASASMKTLPIVAAVMLLVLCAYGSSPVKTIPSSEIAIVIGNTKNTPLPEISGEVSEIIKDTLLQHKGDSTEDLTDSIRIISAVKKPTTITLDAKELKLSEIGNNASNANRNAEKDVKAIENKIQSLTPFDNGANYLEAILEAKDNVKEGSNIIVIGSGLSDDGDLNFSKTNLLTNEQSRETVMQNIKDKYGNDYLDSYNLQFYGLGDTTKPQEQLSSKQKQIVRDLYKDVVRAIGGNADIHTKTLAGASVNSDYVVGTTDTGCGDIGLVFNDDNLKFVSNEAKFTNDSTARESLTSIKNIWDKYRDTIQAIQVDGYIAHYAGPDTLSQPRADTVKQVLVSLGIPVDKITATGKGFGPYPKDAQNRIVKVTISRNSNQCAE